MRNIETLYLYSGLLLPLFYLPQIVKLLNDHSGLASYSLSKAVIQGALRFPSLFFGVYVVHNSTLITIVSMDLIGRTIEFAVAIRALVLYGCSPMEIIFRVFPLETLFARGAIDNLDLDSVKFAHGLHTHALTSDEPLVLPQHTTGQI